MPFQVQRYILGPVKFARKLKDLAAV